MAGSKKNKQKKQHPPPQDLPPPPADDDLMDDLYAQLDSRDQTVQAESAAIITEVQDRQGEGIMSHSKQDAKSRFKARKARKAAAHAQTLSAPDPEVEAKLRREADDEERDIGRVCHEQTLEIHEVNPDGHCLYSAIADQLALLGILPSSQANYTVVRQAASQYMFSHPDDFVPFLAPPTDVGAMTPAGFEQYCVNIRDTAEWGGEPEIQALSRRYNVPIHVVQTGNPPIVVHNPGGSQVEGDNQRVVRISYHRRMYGLGEHYNSLRPKGTLSQISQKMQNILSS